METTLNDNTTARDEWLRQGTESSEQNRTVSDDVSTEPDNKGRGQTAGSGLAGGMERRLTVGCRDDDVTQEPTSKPVCVCGGEVV